MGDWTGWLENLQDANWAERPMISNISKKVGPLLAPKPHDIPADIPTMKKTIGMIKIDGTRKPQNTHLDFRNFFRDRYAKTAA
jgi:hypothetical protein